MLETVDLWTFLPLGYVFSVLIETPVLLLMLSRRHSTRVQWFSAVGLTAVTYPVVVLVMPILLLPYGRLVYLAVAETFAPIAECLLFLSVFGNDSEKSNVRDCIAIIVANLLSFLIGWCWFG